MNRDELSRLSKDELVELVLQLQRPAKTSAVRCPEQRWPSVELIAGHQWGEKCAAPVSKDDLGFGATQL